MALRESPSDPVTIKVSGEPGSKPKTREADRATGATESSTNALNEELSAPTAIQPTSPAIGAVPRAKGPTGPDHDRPSDERVSPAARTEIVWPFQVTEKPVGTGAPAADLVRRNTTLSARPSPFLSNNWTRIGWGP